MRPFSAVYVKIHPRTWYSWISMRVELFGCISKFLYTILPWLNAKTRLHVTGTLPGHVYNNHYREGLETGILRRSIREFIEMQCQGPALNWGSGYELPAVFLDFLSRDSYHLKSRDKINISLLDKDSAKKTNACTLKCIFRSLKLTCFLNCHQSL